MSCISEPVLTTTSTRISAYHLCHLEDRQGYLGWEEFIKKKCKFTEKSVRITEKAKILQNKVCKITNRKRYMALIRFRTKRSFGTFCFLLHLIFSQNVTFTLWKQRGFFNVKKKPKGLCHYALHCLKFGQKRFKIYINKRISVTYRSEHKNGIKIQNYWPTCA